ncbi:MAG: 16S rRNA (adenine(1518)-N(6)/adenine(1519)-N(6))-dimethyltransferase [Proteobacteria bacterium]|nr:MAG: 16S rRNA (adenine(1518)-N(6)/adenine(1519)-N(6))-dimethyltransferase [Pseudomonadota bacterium]
MAKKLALAVSHDRRTRAIGSHRPRRRFGQHFLVDVAYVSRIVAAINPAADDLLVEIGPGLGALTAPLIELLRKLHAVEIDRDLAAQLRLRYEPDRLVVHQADALEFDFSSLGPSLRVVGNLPYNISSPLLFRIAEIATCIRDCHFMLQKEVVDRMVARPGSRTYGRLSVMLQYRFATQKLFDVPAGAFRPRPQVDSAVVRLTPEATRTLVASSEKVFAEVVARAFSQRRKTLRNAIGDLATADEIAALGIDPQLRPERLSVDDFVRLADAVAANSTGSRPSM